MRFKKLIAIGLSCVFTVLTGCSSHQETKKDDTITIYFARHGKTLFNTFDLVQGWADSPLTSQGIEVAKYLGEGLKSIHFDAYYTSDAGRQRETMQVITTQMGAKNYSLNELIGLREVFYGGFEGQTNSKMVTDSMKYLGYTSKTAFFDDYKQGKIFVKDLTNAIAKADSKKMAENYQQVKSRTREALNTIVQQSLKNGDKTVLAISSGMSMQIMIDDLTDDTNKNKPLSNATVVKITYKDGQYHVDEIGSKTYVNQGELDLKK